MKKVIALLLVVMVLVQIKIPLKAYGEDGEGKEKAYEKIKAELRLIPKDLTIEEAVDNGFFVVVQGQLKSNPKIMENFYINTKLGSPSAIKFLLYTVEGEPTVTYLKYDGNSFYGVEDSTRTVGGSKGFKEFNYKCLTKFKEGKLVYYYLFNSDNITFEEYKKNIEEEISSKKIEGRFLVSYDLSSYFINSFNVEE